MWGGVGNMVRRKNDEERESWDVNFDEIII